MFSDYHESRRVFLEIGRRIRSGELDLGRHHYCLSLALGVWQAIHSGYDSIAAVELGVGEGGGLLELVKAAAFFRDQFGLSIDVYGLDNATGLPEPQDYRDHPEIWHAGAFRLSDPEHLRSKLPEWGHLIVGDVKDTIPQFRTTLGERKLAFVSVDLDYYSSTLSAFPIFEFEPAAYVPALPVYLDDVNSLITYCEWCGEEAAIADFNRTHSNRKIAPKAAFRIHNFYVCHILDHPFRQGVIKPRIPFEIMPL